MIKTLKDINWNQVYCFYEVARKLSMKEAGKILHISTSTVSEQIKKLESALEIQLFKRYPRRIALTRDGEALYHCAKEMFDVGGRFLDTISNNSIGGYAVRVAIQDSISASVSASFVSQYWDLYAPYGTINTLREVFPHRLMERVLTNEVDWGVSLEKPKSLRLSYGEIGSFEIVFCCSPRIYRKFKNKEDILRALPLARSSWDQQTNDIVDDYLREHDIFPEEIIESDHNEFCFGLAQRGRCVAIIAKDTVLNSIPHETIRSFSLSKPIITKLYAVWAKSSERMISIKKLKELLKMDGIPEQMKDHDLQIKVSEISNDKLVNPLKK